MADTRENFVRFSLRLPKELMEQLEASTENKRSINAEIIDRLTRSFQSDLVIDAQHQESQLLKRNLVAVENLVGILRDGFVGALVGNQDQEMRIETAKKLIKLFPSDIYPGAKEPKADDDTKK